MPCQELEDSQKAKDDLQLAHDAMWDNLVFSHQQAL